MALSDLGLELQRLPAPLPIWHGPVDRDSWSAAARAVAEQGGRLVSMWGSDRDAAAGGIAACAAYAVPEGLV
ncbi:MAG: Ni,Fe-hydrogenase III large subunit, partial [Rubrivivax sp.]|nr:Ni,Fe-hydrogenase III large subunit [Rubrivivax sp.]